MGVTNSNEKVQLCTSYIGDGPFLYHVSLLADGWETPAMWLVAAESKDEAYCTAIQEHVKNDEYAPSDFKDGMEGYRIGRFL